MFQGWRGVALLLTLLVAQEASSTEAPSLKLGGMLRFSYLYKSWEPRTQVHSRGGDLVFDTFSLRTQAEYKNLSLNAEYRFYSGFSFLRYGYLGYTFSDSLQVQVGETQVPFGILPVPSNNWFNNLTFYVGLEDDSDMGVKALLKSGALDVQLAFYKGDEGSFTGRSLNSARYAFDLVRTTETELERAGVLGARTDRETSQGNVRLAYTFQPTPSFRTEVGLSGLAGGIYNSETQRTGWRWAAAAHLNGQYGPWGVHLQAVSYAFSSSGPIAQDRRFVVMGAFDGAYKVASRAHLLVADVSYTWELARGPVDSLTFYNDHGLMLKSEESFSSSQQNVTGVHVAAGPIHAFIEVAAGRNQPFLGPDFATALAEGREGAGWGFRPNVNVGYYF
ncbi:hypothetical protein [Hyalangium sp.]|uniref:hypothetical protein n=1 Tax=Hyalangium sp. TaxID=2028555 RepID=UPI002D7420BC|nr:hypothetical protein [Hyalangium sp.]HYH97325.1 hypothetical protein [Hyalangium sp.]